MATTLFSLVCMGEIAPSGTTFAVLGGTASTIWLLYRLAAGSAARHKVRNTAVTVPGNNKRSSAGIIVPPSVTARGAVGLSSFATTRVLPRSSAEIVLPRSSADFVLPAHSNPFDKSLNRSWVEMCLPTELAAEASPERRTSARTVIKSVAVRIAVTGSAELDGTVLDRSVGGVCLESRHQVPVGEIAKVRVVVDGEETPWVEVEVRHARMRANRWVLGCRFVSPPALTVRLLFG